MARVLWSGNKNVSMLLTLKKFRENGSPPKIMANFEVTTNIETMSLQKIKNYLEKDMQLDTAEICGILGIESSRENLVNVAIAAILVSNDGEVEIQNNPKKRKLNEDPTTKAKSASLPSEKFNRNEFRDRIVELDSFVGSKKYNAQKEKLETELEFFLNSLIPPQSISSVSVYNMREFLVFKDKDCKTQVHVVDCPFKGSLIIKECVCPVRRAASSLDSLIGQLRAIFRDRGRGSGWNEDLGLGNPMASAVIKRHLEATRIEQNLALVTSKQAKPLFLEKIVKLSRYLKFQLSNPQLSLRDLYLLQRDDVFFRFLGFSGDRAGDLANLRTEHVKYLPDRTGVIVRLMEGKTIKGTPRVIVILKGNSDEVCPVRGIAEYVDWCEIKELGLRSGYLFRSCRSIVDLKSNKPVTSSAMNIRLKKHLQNAGLWKGETPHGARGACAMSLKLLGIPAAGICQHVGWKSPRMLDKYTTALTLVENTASARLLSQNADRVETEEVNEMSANMCNWSGLDSV